MPPQENVPTIMDKPWMAKENLEKWLKTPIKEIECNGGSGKGENYLSTMRKLSVTAEDGRTFSLVIKRRLLNGTTADVFGKTGIFRKEVELYGNTIYAIQDILKEAYPDDEEPIAAECYYACEDFLVLEDLMTSGFKMHDRMTGLDLEQCLLVLRTLAKFHAASVILYERNPRTLDEFDICFLQEPSLQEPFDNFISGLTLTLAEELESWDEEWHQYIPKLKHLARNSIARVRDNATRRDTDFNVLLHGDLWTNNMLLRGRISGIRFVDFQLANFSSPVLDLHYFIGTSAMTDVRTNHIQKLIKEYHQTLSHTLMVLGYEKQIPTLEELHQEYERKALFGLFALLGPYSVMQCDPDCGLSFDELLATGTTPGTKTYGDIYKRNIKVMLPWLAKKGGFETGA